MEKYIKPETKYVLANAEELLTVSLPQGDDEIGGDDMLGKDNVWDGGDDATRNLWDD